MAVNLSTLLNSSFVVNGGPLDGLSDVVISAPLNVEDVLMYDGSTWINDATISTNVLTPLGRSTSGLLVPITVSTTAPTSPSTGDLWVDTN